MKHSCIDQLARFLDEAEVQYERRPIWNGEQIRIGALCDAVCHDFSYGNQEDLLEIQGGLTEEECEFSLVKGWMLPEEVAKRFIYCHKNNTSTYREEK